jgi:hypothetical protein
VFTAVVGELIDEMVGGAWRLWGLLLAAVLFCVSHHNKLGALQWGLSYVQHEQFSCWLRLACVCADMI